jgi:hypothetical protein
MRQYAPFATREIDLGAAQASAAAQREIEAEELQKAREAAERARDEVLQETDRIREVMSDRYGLRF